MAHKPRNSVLYMFDPLESITTPRRDGSPDSQASNSDKENDVQPGDVTMFFNRIYTSHDKAAPKTPNGKLIDFCDTTMDDAWDSGEEDVLCTARPLVEPTSRADMSDEHSLGRRPLADIELEEPPERAELQDDQACGSFDEEEVATPLGVVTAAPTGAPLADVINSINLSAMTISGSAPPSPLAGRSPLPPLKEESDAGDSDEEGDFMANYGETEDTVCIPLLITVSSPTGTYEESNSLTDMVLPSSSESPTDRLFASSTADPTPPTRRPFLKNRVANDDPRRTSVDLHASFSMQMQSVDMSFDLLNDKISFHAGDSMWAGGDDEDEAFDMAAEMQKMEAAAGEYERTQQNINDSAIAMPDAASVPLPEEHDEVMYESGCTQSTVDTSVDHMGTTSTEPAVPTPVVDNLPEDDAASSADTINSARRGQSIDTGRCQPVRMLSGSPTLALGPRCGTQSPPADNAAPAPIPALRIVKKTWKVHGRTDSGTSTGSSASSSSTGAPRTRSTSPTSSAPSDSCPSATATNKVEKVAPSLPIAEPALPRTVIRGVQRPPPGAEITSTGVIVPATSAHSQLRPGPQAKSRASLAREASARFAAAGLQRPNLQQGQRPPQPPPPKAASAAARAQRTGPSIGSAVPKTASTGRAPATAGAAAKTVGNVGGLRAPSASGIPARSLSALPRPASRLPAPSAGFRSRDAKATAPGARVPSSSARRAF